MFRSIRIILAIIIFTIIALVTANAQNYAFGKYSYDATVKNELKYTPLDDPYFEGFVHFIDSTFSIRIFLTEPFLTYDFNEETHFFDGTYEVDRIVISKYREGTAEVLKGEDLFFKTVSVTTMYPDTNAFYQSLHRVTLHSPNGDMILEK